MNAEEISNQPIVGRRRPRVIKRLRHKIQWRGEVIKELEQESAELLKQALDRQREWGFIPSNLQRAIACREEGIEKRKQEKAVLKEMLLRERGKPNRQALMNLHRL
jgi:hypothetical protein